MKELLNTWINLEEEYNGKYYKLIKCPFCKPKILIKPESHIPKYCPYCGIKLKFINFEWDDDAIYIHN